MLGIFVVLVIVVFLIIKHNATSPYQFISVSQGSITEMVSVTGNTIPTQSVSLGFNNSGTIAKIYSSIGVHVNKGDMLATLNMSDLEAQLQQAQANVDMETAKFDSLKAGASPEDIAVSQSALDKANQDLVNLYRSVTDISTDSYAKANDAVRTELRPFFENGETQSASLTYTTSDSQAQTDAQIKRFSATIALNEWQNQFLNISQSNSGLEMLTEKEVSYLATIQQLLNTVSKTLDSSSSLDAATLAAYKSQVFIALTEVNLATKNLNTLSQDIASQKLVISQAQAALNLKQAGSTEQDIAAQEANVENAQANIANVQAKFANSKIVAPINGVVTQFDAKVGQIATPGVALISIISDGGYEVDAGVSETDIGKILVDDKVTMTLDAFLNETFTGSVFYIAPAETNIGGVINYQIKISFDKPDPRLKSGLTANIDIQTRHKDNVLVLPQYAILQNDQGIFVETLENKKIKQNPVTLGIADQKGNVEVISGVTLGEQVLNIGLKAQ